MRQPSICPPPGDALERVAGAVTSRDRPPPTTGAVSCGAAPLVCYWRLAVALPSSARTRAARASVNGASSASSGGGQIPRLTNDMTHETIERTEAAFELVETMTGVHGTVTLSGGTAVVRIDGDTEQYRFDGFDRALRSGRYYVPGPDAWDALQARLEDR